MYNPFLIEWATCVFTGDFQMQMTNPDKMPLLQLSRGCSIVLIFQVFSVTCRCFYLTAFNSLQVVP